MKNGSGVEAGRLAASWGDAQSGVTDLGQARQSYAKRALDLAITLPVVVFLAPVFLLILLAVKLTSEGPAFFAQRRVGLNGRTFVCYKFRTMRIDAAERLDRLLASDPDAAREWAQFQKLRNDPRVTVLGRFLRKSSLDELPQLINVMRGDMSIVGPRPITSAEIHRYGSGYVYYTAVRPGIVGLWQVSGRNSLTYEQRVAYDVEYVRNWSILTDLRILVRAIPVVLFASGAY
jgi:Undecaprenyl-phosphate galactose phosphotransferase WbaP